ncbi:hypothetical protein ACN28G_08620 [Micromonospora sp. WMMA1923]
MSEDREAQVGVALHRIVELFGAICASPDDLDLAREADSALAELNRLLTA